MPPWDAFDRATFGTCEPDVAGWIVHPAETGSALAYVAVALTLWLRYRQTDRRLPVRVLPATAGAIGAAALLLHASFAALFQTLDLAVISLFTGYMLAAALVHRRRIARPSFRRTFLTCAVAGVVAPLIHLGLGFAMVTAQAAGVLWLWRGTWLGDARKDARAATWLLLPGALLLMLDHAGIGCLGNRLEHVVQPHAAWHLASAASIWFFYRTERQLERRWH